MLQLFLAQNRGRGRCSRSPGRKGDSLRDLLTYWLFPPPFPSSFSTRTGPRSRHHGSILGRVHGLTTLRHDLLSTPPRCPVPPQKTVGENGRPPAAGFPIIIIAIPEVYTWVREVLSEQALPSPRGSDYIGYLGNIMRYFEGWA